MPSITGTLIAAAFDLQSIARITIEGLPFGAYFPRVPTDESEIPPAPESDRVHGSAWPWVHGSAWAAVHGDFWRAVPGSNWPNVRGGPWQNNRRR